MSELFLKIVNRSISASWLVLAVLILRPLLKKAPRWVSVLLWGLVGVRMVCPISIESGWSLIPSAQTVNPDIMMAQTPELQSGVPAIDSVLNPVIRDWFTPESVASANPLQILIPILSGIWLTGMTALLLYTVVSSVSLKRRVSTAVRYRGNIFQSENVGSPFVFGIVSPKIYLPFALEEQMLPHVIAHEQAHIRRRDHWWKPLGFLLLTVHWFNPLMWLGYGLLCRDIELACDEKVIRELGSEERAAYTQALVNCSVNRARIAACPLAFGEVGVKERVKSVVNYKKPTFWILILSVLACAVAAVCFLTNPKQDSFSVSIVIPAGSQEGFVYSQTEISPTRNAIVLTSGEGLGDTEVILKPVEGKQENAYDEATYLTPGMPVTLEAEKGGWFQIGVRVSNPTDQDRTVSVNVKYVEVRVAARSSVFIGDASKVSAIAQSLPYPEGCTYSSLALQTAREPYGMTVSLHGDAEENALMLCGAAAFQKIGNLGTITFRNADSGEEMGSFMRIRKEDLKCYLVIGAEDIAEIGLEVSGISGGCINADGSTFRKGEKIWLEQLDGCANLQGLKITALDQQGNTVWKWVVQDVWPWNALTLSDADDSVCVRASETGRSYICYEEGSEDRWELTNVK